MVTLSADRQAFSQWRSTSSWVADVDACAVGPVREPVGDIRLPVPVDMFDVGGQANKRNRFAGQAVEKPSDVGRGSATCPHR